MTSFLTGITEPIEFSFLFVAPWLYVVHAFLDGLSFLVADLLSIRIGNSFSGGVIDFLLFGVLQGNDKTNWLLVLPVGLVWAGIYYVVFRFLISKFKVAIPGMTVNEETSVQSSKENSSLSETSRIIIKALGGEANIEHVTACATRLRVSLADSHKVDKESLKSTGATAVLDVDNGIQAVYGEKAILYSQEINEILGKEV